MTNIFEIKPIDLFYHPWHINGKLLIIPLLSLIKCTTFVFKKKTKQKRFNNNKKQGIEPAWRCSHWSYKTHAVPMRPRCLVVNICEINIYIHLLLMLLWNHGKTFFFWRKLYEITESYLGSILSNFPNS